ncbi:hypothetical protein F2Q68_00045561 [Brassica cretica]|uniref:Leucine-rich repeat-containing N-terminal plant-type domain-containing protein n=1 Tax=Brassica cretica TaxID=69181 RepID=A0A8S9LHC5_BRACR|nr:hypothetical protein F2Q68_00045561 [Brassica cretica]
MEGKLFLKQYLIWVMILLLGQLHGYKSCILKERNALLDLKKFLISTTEEGQSEPVLPTWTNDTTSECCQWERVKCNSTSGRVLELSIRGLNLKESSLLNFSLLHPFEEVQSVDLSESKFGGFFDGAEGYKSLSRLRNLEILDLSSNKFNISVFPFLNAATSLTTLLLQGNNMNSPFPAKELSALVKLKFLDLSGNGFSGSMELQGKDLQTEASTRARYQSKQSCFFSLDSLANLSMLKVFGVNSRSNLFQVVSEGSWKPKFQLNAIALRSCNLVKVPLFLLHQKDLRHVDLSDNNISGQFPSWLLANNTKLDVLLLQNNYLTSFQLPRSAHNLLFLDLSIKVLTFVLVLSCGRVICPEDAEISVSRWFSFTGYKSLGRLRNLEILDLSYNEFNSSIFPFLSAATSLKTLFLGFNRMDGPFLCCLFLELKDLINLQLLDLSQTNLNGSIPIQELSVLRKLEALDLSDNEFYGSLESQGKTNHILSYSIKTGEKGFYTGVSGGAILKYTPEKGFVRFAQITESSNSLLCYALQEPISSKMCGRPAGIAFNEITGDLYVADALLGLHVVSPAGGLAVKIADGVDGKAFESLNGLDVDPTTGIVYFTSLSSQFSA